MRFKKESGDIKIYMVAGTQTVLMAFHLDESKLKKDKQFLGFSIERTDDAGKTITMNGSKHFNSLIHDNTITDRRLKYVSLVQSFFWKDYTADPGKKYTYTIKAMFGTPLQFKAKYENKISISTEPLMKGKHSVFFNFGVTGSQGYASNREFGNKPIHELDEEAYHKALSYLSRELYNEGLKTFAMQATGKRYSLYCAFYEIHYPEFANLLKEVRKKGATVEIVYSAQSGQNKPAKHANDEKGNKATLTDAGLLNENTYGRTKANQPHNKFMILCENGEPIEVWTGSTNITMSGIYGQCNTGHWIKDKAIAKKFLTYWTALKDNPTLSDLAPISEQIQPNQDLTQLKKGTFVFFSPRNLPAQKGKTAPQILEYVNLIDKAEELVCMVFPFNYDEAFKKVYDKKRNYLRYLIFEKSAQAKIAKDHEDNDVNLKVTGGAVLESNVERFVKEVTPKRTVDGGILFVHNKFFLVDPLSDVPVVVSGSANFSNASIHSNDENTVLIKGDKRVADIYLTEFNRLFEHFWPRYIRELYKKLKKTGGFEKALDEKYLWYKTYYRSSSYHYKRGQLFIKMKGAKNG